MNNEKIFHGIGAAPGVAFGKVFVHVDNELYIPTYKIEEDEKEGEVGRFELALLKTRHEISEIRMQVAKRLGEEEAQIFDAHLMVLEDPALIDETISDLRSGNHNVEYAFQKISNKYIGAFKTIDDDFIKERLNDIKDVSRRILFNLAGETMSTMGDIEDNRIVLAHDFAPSNAASVPNEHLLGFITEAGSRTSHVVIMAKAANVPGVVSATDVMKFIQKDDEVIVDGFEGLIILNPSEQTLFKYGELKKQKETQQRHYLEESRDLAITRDGTTVQVSANIEGNGEIDRVLGVGADGIGLYRTEYLFIKAGNYPSEDEQFHSYKEVVERMNPSPVILRTFDLGGDKVFQRKEMFAREDNPFLGCRAVRFALQYPEIFKDQLRAMLRASAFGKLKIMFPMVSGLDELKQANQLLVEAKQDLIAENIAFDDDLEVGIMIEIPSAAFTCDILAEHCDFFSIGTNDLMQYMLAVDRGNERVAHLYDPAHPAMVRVLMHIFSVSKEKNQPVSICGEMAGDPIFVALLAGMGLRQFSVSPTFVPETKYLLRKFTIEEAEELVEKAMEIKDPEAVTQMLKQFTATKMGE